MLNRFINRLLERKSAFFCVVIGYLAMVSCIASAKPFVPKSDEIVASWEPTVPSDEISSDPLARIQWHMQLGQLAGMSNLHYSRAQQQLDTIAPDYQQNALFWYLRARSLQHQHDFAPALAALNKSLQLEPGNINAWLLKSNLHLVQNDFEKAQRACLQILGNGSLTLVSVCSLEVASYTGSVKNSYAQISRIVDNLDSIEQTDLIQQPGSLWMVQVAADMALRLDQPEQASKWLSAESLADKPLSYIALWSDIQRALGNHQLIETKLAEIVRSAPFQDDALLVRLAMAERAMIQQNSLATSTTDKTDSRIWQPAMAARVELRIKRDDRYHAADLARYFLYVEPDKARALLWATRNYQQSKLHEDSLLLAEAEQFSGDQIRNDSNG